MVDSIVSFIRTIAIYLIFYAFVEMILPNSNLKKYINLCLGLIMLIILIEPVVNIINNGDGSFQFDDIEIELNQKIQSNENYEQLQQNLIMQSYKQQLAEQISKLILQKADVTIIKLDLEVNEDSSSAEYGQLTALTVKIAVQAETDEIILIKKVIYDFYNTPLDNIYVVVN